MSSSPATPKPNPNDRPCWGDRLPRSAILRGRPRFNELFERGERLGNSQFTLLYRPVSRFAHERGCSLVGAVGFVTPKKLGSAPVRNRLRRQMREVFRKDFEGRERLYGAEKGWELVFMAKPAALKLDIGGIRSSLLHLYGKLRQRLDERCPGQPTDSTTSAA